MLDPARPAPLHVSLISCVGKCTRGAGLAAEWLWAVVGVPSQVRQGPLTCFVLVFKCYQQRAVQRHKRGFQHLTGDERTFGSCRSESGLVVIVRL